MLKFAKKHKLVNSRDTLDFSGVVDGVYIRLRETDKNFPGAGSKQVYIILSALLGAKGKSSLEVRRRGDFADWVSAISSGQQFVEFSEEFPDLSVYTFDNKHNNIDPIVLREINAVFSGDGEWRLFAHDGDCEIMWRVIGAKANYRILCQNIDGMIRIDKSISNVDLL